MEPSCVFKFFFGYIVMTAIVAKSDAYAVCGDPTYKSAESQAAINKVLKRYMELRTPNWIWDSVSTITVIQVGAPKRFFGRWKTTNTMETLVKDYMDYLEPLDIVEVTFVARSLCSDPRRFGGHDLLSSIHDSMSVFLANETEALEADHVIDFSLMLSALCINDYPIDPRLVNGLLVLQNEDGSFGPAKHAADTTISMLRPVFCLSRMRKTQFNVTAVLETVIKMRNFIKTKVSKPHPKSTGVFIGPDAMTSANALVGLYKTMQPGEDPNKEWRCREVMNTLGLDVSNSDDEDSLHEHLLRISATDYLDLQGPDYACLDRKDLDPIPTGYKPTCVYEKPETCGWVTTSESPK